MKRNRHEYNYRMVSLTNYFKQWKCNTNRSKIFMMVKKNKKKNVINKQLKL